MKKTVFMAGAALLAFAVPGVASAQETAPTTNGFVGVQVGLHDLGVDLDEEDTDGFDIDDSALIYGGYGGVDFNIGRSAVAGIEGNFNFGNGPIDNEFGLAARVGVRAGTGTVIFARAGYQWVNIDASGLIGVDDDVLDDDDLDVDDTIGDFLVGVGADIAVGEAMGIRVAVDTVGLDTIRGTAGLHFRF